MNFEAITKGKWTWQDGKKRSVLDYVLASQGIADSVTQMTVDDEGWFDIGSDHNLMFWESRGLEEVGGVKASETKRRVKHNWV